MAKAIASRIRRIGTSLEDSWRESNKPELLPRAGRGTGLLRNHGGTSRVKSSSPLPLHWRHLRTNEDVWAFTQRRPIAVMHHLAPNLGGRHRKGGDRLYRNKSD